MINYQTGDATNPKGLGPKVIVHCCNDIGGWGRGFVLALSAKWSEPEAAYRTWYKEKGPDPFKLGQVQFVKVENDLWVANIIGQCHIKPTNGLPPVRYEALEMGLRKVAEFCLEHGASLHMPRIGCGLAGGDWDKMEDIINRVVVKKGVEVTVYDLP